MPLDHNDKKQIAKVGMAGTLAITVASALRLKGRFMKNLHTGAGALFTGLALWHHYLYQVEPVNKPVKEQQTTEIQE